METVDCTAVISERFAFTAREHAKAFSVRWKARICPGEIVALHSESVLPIV